MSNNPLISIIIPVYNVEKHIGACIQSVLDQSYLYWELILVDDHSTDNSYTICREYEKSNESIHLIRNTKKGVSSARNLGIQYAKGDYLFFIDSDDTIDSFALETLANNSFDQDFVLAGYSIIDVQQKRTKTFVPAVFNGTISEFCCNIRQYTFTPFLLGPCWKLFKRKIIEANSLLYPEDLSYGEDAYFVFDYLKYVATVRVVEKSIYNYFLRGISLSHGFKEEKYQINIMLNKKLYNLCKQYGIDNIELYYDDIRNSFSTYINELAMSKTTKKKKSILKNAANLEETKEAFNLKLKMDTKKKVIAIFLKLRLYFLLYEVSVINTRRY